MVEEVLSFWYFLPSPATSPLPPAPRDELQIKSNHCVMMCLGPTLLIIIKTILADQFVIYESQVGPNCQCWWNIVFLYPREPKISFLCFVDGTFSNAGNLKRSRPYLISVNVMFTFHNKVSGIKSEISDCPDVYNYVHNTCQVRFY